MTLRRAVLAGGYGAVAGGVTAIVFRAMQALTNAIWGSETTPHSALTVFGTIMLGGALIALLRRVETRLAGGAPPSPDSFGQQLKAAATLPVDHLRRGLMVGLAATLAVAFGGAVGPDAGLVAVATELSALVAALLARDADERRLIGAAGAAGALGGFYASPPAGAFLAESPGPEDRLPRALVFLASVAGLAGFVLVLEMLPGGEGHLVVALPDYTPSRTASELLAVVPPALAGGLVGLAFVTILPRLRAGLETLGGPVLQTLTGTLAFAALAALWPELRFSGHHQIGAMLEWGAQAGPGPLAMLAGLKVLALSLCLAAGWRGGAIFPLLFAGAAAGAAVAAAVPLQAPVSAGLLAGMTAAATLGMGRPVAAVLIVAFLVSPTAIGPLSIGALIGVALARLGPPPRLH